MRNNTILIVDDDPGAIQLLGRILADTGQLKFATCGEDALRLALAAPPALILLDAEMPGMSGFAVCEALKADPALAQVPVIFITSHCEAAFEVAGLDIGAADFIAKPVNPQIVLARVKTQLRMKALADELHRVATIDVLTGVANRRQFVDSLDREWRRGRRSGLPIALLMVDVDHFKAYNDRYGHPAGDICLRGVAQALAATSTRPADLVARYGGEEFVVLLPQTARAGAEHMAHTLLDAVEALGLEHEGSSTANHVTVSIGIGCYDDQSAGWWGQGPPAARVESQHGRPARADCLIRAADQALYAAKRGGRAQARLLDFADVDHPERAREIGPSSHLPRNSVRGELSPS